MIAEILTHTPVWVWAMLAFLIYRGFLATRERDAAVPNLLILPVVLLGLSLEGIYKHYGVTLAPLGIWLVAALCGAGLGSRTIRSGSVGVGRNGVLLRGSWFPLVLVVAVFLTKYITEVMIAMRPDLMLQPDAIYGVCALYGALTGFFLGRVVRILMIYRDLPRSAAHAPQTSDPAQ